MFILITSENPFNITNASIQFKDKFVFYSPAITTAVDFSIDEPQDHFIFIRGRSINPLEIFQQTTRTRKIKHLYFYSEAKPIRPRYTSLEQVKDEIKNNLQICKPIFEAFTFINEDDELELVENTFFNLYCYFEYINDCYNTHKTWHYKIYY